MSRSLITRQKSNNVLVTSVPMATSKEAFIKKANDLNLNLQYLIENQTVQLDELKSVVANYDGWIIGDDPCPRQLLEIGRRGNLRAIVKWGIGLDNVDISAAKELGISVTNTPLMLGKEVADLALTYMNMLARHVIPIHESVVRGEWHKPIGISLQDKCVGIVGFGDIGKNLHKRCSAADMKVTVFEISDTERYKSDQVKFSDWPVGIEDLDFLVFACPLTEVTRHMLNESLLKKLQHPLYLINVSRGGIVSQEVLVEGLSSGLLRGVALDVYEYEPLPSDSILKDFNNVIFGTHNASNTFEAVSRVSNIALEKVKLALDSI